MTDLSKIYRTSDIETMALQTINLEIERGEFVAIMGPSGCGKSTFLNVAGMLDAPSSGQYIFGGEEVSGHSESKLAALRKQHIGFVFQSFNLIDELTVEENVALPLLYQKRTAAERSRRVAEALERVDIAHRAGHRPQQLSGGQQQRVAVARAVVGAPDLILADEPTGNLDSKNGDEVMDLLTGLNNEGTTIVMVTHAPAYADCAHRTINLFDGCVVSENVVRLSGSESARV
jgi:putative ABC transport system ATP-binding protein